MVYNMEENINITVNNRCLFAKAQTRPSLSLSLSFTVHVPTLNHLSTTPTTTFTTSLHPFNLFCFSSPKSRDEMNEKTDVADVASTAMSRPMVRCICARTAQSVLFDLLLDCILEEATGLAFRFVIDQRCLHFRRKWHNMMISFFWILKRSTFVAEKNLVIYYRLAFFKAAYALFEADFCVKADDDIYLRPGLCNPEKRMLELHQTESCTQSPTVDSGE
ncbi:hypothetical protein JHK82_034732 [Glycine max]|nr:hypothetical protein JHK82_034732 [Glycine max]